MMSEDEKERYLIKQQRYVARMRNKRMYKNSSDQEDNDYKGINWFQMITTPDGSGLKTVVKFIGGCSLIILSGLAVYCADVLKLLPQLTEAFKGSLSMVVIVIAYLVAQEKTIKYGYRLWFDEQAHYSKEARFWKATIFFIINFVLSGAIIASVWIVFVKLHWKIDYKDGKPLTAFIALINFFIPIMIEVFITICPIRWIRYNDPELITY